MSAESMGDSAGDAASPAVRRQTSLQHRQYVLCPSSAPSTQGNQHPPQEQPDGPWSEYDNSAASEVLHHDHDLNLHFHHHQNPRQQQYRNFSDPIRPSSPAKYPQEAISNVPVLSPVPISPRWDSLAKSSVVTFNNLSSGDEIYANTLQRVRTDSTPTPRGAPRSAFPGLSSNPYIPEEPNSPPAFVTQFRKFPLFVRGQNDAQRPPLTPTSTTSSGDSRPASQRTASTERNMTVENFSRPRKPSVRSREPSLRQAPTSHPYPEQYPDQVHNTQAHLNHNGPLEVKRTRGMSLSSSKSSSTLSSIRHRPSNDHLGPNSRADSQRRVETSGGSSASLARQALSPNKNTSQPQSREAPPWVTTDDELRSSFRSQLTASTAQGTLFTTTGTERSSVLTGNSSITEQSIINGYARTSWRTNSMADDGPSVEDVMVMYERGFNDSDIESVRRSMRFADDDEEDDDAPKGATGHGGFGVDTLRPSSSHSDVTGVGAKMLEALNDPLPMPRPIPVPESRRSSARFSGINFRFSLVPNSLPKDIGSGFAAGHFGRKKETDLNGPGKHDSGKLLDRDDVEHFTPRAATSKPASPTKVKPIQHVSELPVAEPQPANPTPAPQLPVEPPEVPGSRDRYGFKKVSANVTREQYDEWDEGYTEYLARRRKKWVAFLKDNSLMTDRPNRFPPRNAKTKRFIRKGIPPDWRGAAWFYYAGGPAILSKHRGVYQSLVERAGLDPNGPGMLPGRKTEVKPLVVEDIEKDLHRTFPDNIRFKPPQPASPPPPPGDNGDPSLSRTKTGPEPEIIGSLRRVLHAFALYNPRIGYCQSLNFLAGMLLLFVESEEQAFWLLNVITRVYLPGTHEMSLEGSKVDLGVLMTALKDSLPQVWKQIGGDEVEPSVAKKGRTKRSNKSIPSNHTINDPNRLPAITLCMTAWFMSCFIGTLPTETVLRVWDVFFYEGSRTLFRIALTIFKLGEAEIKAVTDPMEMFGVVQAFPRRLIDCNALMDACYKRRNGIGHLSQELVEAKRQERREGIRRWKAEQEAAALGSGDGHLGNGANLGSKAAGLDLAGDPQDVRRKGTLFGRRPKNDREQTRAAEVI
ncbi:hypothetical protein V8F20_007342 [Naviculisporaceae sp. PSN 640]